MFLRDVRICTHKSTRRYNPKDQYRPAKLWLSLRAFRILPLKVGDSELYISVSFRHYFCQNGDNSCAVQEQKLK
jgi:hypothetical protein